MLQLQTLLREIDWIVPQRARQLEKFGLRTVEDLLTHFPRRYEDRTRFDHFPTEEKDAAFCILGTVTKVAAKRLRGWQKMIEVTLEESENRALNATLVCRWFNAHFVQKMIAVGMRLVVYGKPKKRAKKIIIDHPEFEIVETGDEQSIHLKRIVPIYRATEGLSTRQIRELIFRLLAKCDDAIFRDFLPNGLDATSPAAAMRAIHFPADWDALQKARRHLVVSEFFAMQICIAAKRAENAAQPGAAHAAANGELLEKFHASLPFPLTNAQRRAIGEIREDLAATRPMNRLLHGDVGSGKTLVALSAMLLCVEVGFQAALMAPTQILAEQHYMNFKRWLAPLGISVALRTGSKKEDTVMPLFAVDGSRAANHDLPQIIIGTHALLYDESLFSTLGLIIIDEQHKFGVQQRARLIDKAVAPDVLVMTATPIPRTLTMTVFGDLDVSVLDELPANRGKIITGVRDQTKLPDAVKFIREHLEKGRQAFIVYPLIDGSEKLETKAAAQEFEKWKSLLAPMPCELLHGRIPPEEKEAIMRRFRDNETRALVATSVIEVGIDVPNANIMLIENAERFGLAQLHQLRGRIGRGEHKSYCVLISELANDEAREKLMTLEKTANGFEVAEADLRLRGPGDILGTAQSGLAPLKLGNLVRDVDLMQIARKAAMRIFENDSRLAKPQHQIYRAMIEAEKLRTFAQVS